MKCYRSCSANVGQCHHQKSPGQSAHLFGLELSIEFFEVRVRLSLNDRGPPALRLAISASSPDASAAKLRKDPDIDCIVPHAEAHVVDARFQTDWHCSLQHMLCSPLST